MNQLDKHIIATTAHKTRSVNTHIDQYIKFRATCLKKGIAHGEILPLWHTHQLNLNKITLHELDSTACELLFEIRELTGAVGSIGHATLNVEMLLNRIAVAIECR